MNKEQFVDELNKIGIEITNEQMEKLDLFYKILLDWNSKINLTTIIVEKDVYLKHFYDSLTLCKVADLTSNLSLCDVGTGAGFPGIVLKIVFPNLKITLIDSLNKRVLYLNDVIDKLGLSEIVAIHARMEEFSKVHQEEFDIVTARAVASISVLSEICVSSMKIGGSLILMKANADEELLSSIQAMSKLNLSLKETCEFFLPVEDSIRTLIRIEKSGKTNKQYPRNIDKIRKYPL